MIRAASSSSAAVSRLQRPPYNPLKATIISLAVGADAAAAAEPRKIDGYYIEAHCVCCRRRRALAAAAYVVIVFPRAGSAALCVIVSSKSCTLK